MVTYGKWWAANRGGTWSRRGGEGERKIGDTLRKFPRDPFREKTVSPKGTPIFEVYYSRKIDIDKRLSDKV